jgi:hypothetical protein
LPDKIIRISRAAPDRRWAVMLVVVGGCAAGKTTITPRRAHRLFVQAVLDS